MTFISFGFIVPHFFNTDFGCHFRCPFDIVLTIFLCSMITKQKKIPFEAEQLYLYEKGDKGMIRVRMWGKKTEISAAI